MPETTTAPPALDSGELPKTQDMTDQELVTYCVQVDEARANAAKIVETAKAHRQTYWNELHRRHGLGKKVVGLNGEERFIIKMKRGDVKYKNVLFRALAFVLRTQTRTRASLVKEVARLVQEEASVSSWGELKESLPKLSPPTTPEQREAEVLALLSQSETQES